MPRANGSAAGMQLPPMSHEDRVEAARWGWERRTLGDLYHPVWDLLDTRPELLAIYRRAGSKARHQWLRTLAMIVQMPTATEEQRLWQAMTVEIAAACAQGVLEQPKAGLAMVRTIGAVVELQVAA